MSNNQQVARRAAAEDQVVQRAPVNDSAEIHEQYASAEAKAGFNLNIFAALSGSMSRRSTKTTDTRPDGSSRSIETTDTAAQAQGRGAANMQAVAEARSDAGKRYAHGQQAIEHGSGTKNDKQDMIKAKQKKQEMDHLGIEGRWN